MDSSPHVATLLQPAPSAPSAEVSPRRRETRFRPRALLAAPRAEAREALARELVGAGFEVLAAPAMEPLWGELGEGRPLPHVVLVAARAADGTLAGLTACERLRAEPRTAALPVYVLAGEETAALREQVGAVGADDVLVGAEEARGVVTLARLKAGRGAFATAYEAHSARLPLSELVRALLGGMRSGRVELRDNEGWLTFHRGQVVDASYEGETGLIGLRRLLFFGSGAYAVSFASFTDGAGEAGKPLLHPRVFTSLLLPAVERFTALCALGIPLAARLAVDSWRLAEMLSTLPDDVGQVIRLCDGQRTVHAAVLECELPEVTTQEVVTCLYAQGVLVPANFLLERMAERQLEREARESPCLPAPSFFEPGAALDEEPFAEAFAAVA